MIFMTLYIIISDLMTHDFLALDLDFKYCTNY